MIKYVLMAPEEVEEDLMQEACRNEIKKQKIK